jgi:hypothetical protein
MMIVGFARFDERSIGVKIESPRRAAWEIEQWNFGPIGFALKAKDSRDGRFAMSNDHGRLPVG